MDPGGRFASGAAARSQIYKEACAGPTQTFVRPDTRATGNVGEVGNEFRPTSVRGRTPTPSPVK